jgi:hypothetical protein
MSIFIWGCVPPRMFDIDIFEWLYDSSEWLYDSPNKKCQYTTSNGSHQSKHGHSHYKQTPPSGDIIPQIST